MKKRTVEKDEFYNELLELMGGATKSICFYSISCCFGFYSFGVRNFERVFNAIRDRVKLKHAGKFLDVRVMVKIDPDNPMDIYAAERLATLQTKFEHTGGEDQPRKIFRELVEDPKEPAMIQFLIVDGKRVLSSNVQDEVYNEDLDLVLNVSQPGVRFEKEDDEKEFNRLEKTFESAWGVAIQLESKKPRFSRRRLRYILQNYSGVRPANSERELQLLLTGYLRGQIDPSIIDVEAMMVSTRIDLVVGPRPHQQRSGIEIKFKPRDADIDGIVGKMRNYRNDLVDLVLVVGAPDFSAQGRSRLLSELNKINVPLIDIR